MWFMPFLMGTLLIAMFGVMIAFIPFCDRVIAPRKEAR